MSKKLYLIPEGFAATARVKRIDYQQMYAESVENPDRFWGRAGRRIDWIKEFSRVKDSSFAQSDYHIRWFYDGTLNVASNCLNGNYSVSAIRFIRIPPQTPLQKGGCCRTFSDGS